LLDKHSAEKPKIDFTSHFGASVLAHPFWRIRFGAFGAREMSLTPQPNSSKGVVIPPASDGWFSVGDVRWMVAR
jgi:hypothetical protein